MAYTSIPNERKQSPRNDATSSNANATAANAAESIGQPDDGSNARSDVGITAHASDSTFKPAPAVFVQLRRTYTTVTAPKVRIDTQALRESYTIAALDE